MTDTLDDAAKNGITEFDVLDPTELHLVGAGANGFTALAAKSAATVIDESGDLSKARFAGFCGVPDCVVCKGRFGKGFDTLIERAGKKRLKAKDRRALPKGAFAIPEKAPGPGSYPIHDESHARSALSELHNASPDEQKRIKAAVHRRYPNIDMEKASQNSHEDGPTPSPSGSEGQTRQNHPHMGAVHMEVTPEGYKVTMPTFAGHPAPSADQEGHGSTAPNKTIPKGEALSQTRGNTRKGGDGHGTPAPGGDADADAAEREAREQTEELTRKAREVLVARGMTSPDDRAKEIAATLMAQKAAGDAAWEQHDADVAEHIGELAQELEEREKAEQNTTKEIEDMTPEELTKMLDERDVARRAAKQQKKEAAKAKADAKKAKMKAKADAKAKAKQDEMDVEKRAILEKAAVDPQFAADLHVLKQAKKDRKAAKKAAKGPALPESVLKDLAGIKELVEKVAGTPMPIPVLNEAGIRSAGGVPALRGTPGGEGGAFKALEDKVAKAAESGTVEEFSKAQSELTTARLVAFERLRAGGLSDAEAMARVGGTPRPGSPAALAGAR
jgi:hypothetical protein